MIPKFKQKNSGMVVMFFYENLTRNSQYQIRCEIFEQNRFEDWRQSLLIFLIFSQQRQKKLNSFQLFISRYCQILEFAK